MATILKKVDREMKGEGLSTSRNVLYLVGSKDTYYVQSERSNDIYYLVKYNPDVVEYCTCCDFTIRLSDGQFCKHLYAVIFSITKGTLKEIEKFNGKTFANTTIKSWRDDTYDF